jgi:hypothetical protein
VYVCVCVRAYFVILIQKNIKKYVKSRRMRQAGNLARMGERRGIYRVLVGKPEGKRPFGRPRRRWKGGSSESRMWGHGLVRADSG